MAEATSRRSCALESESGTEERMGDSQNYEKSDRSYRMARAARIALEFRGVIIPDDATPEELLMLEDTPPMARAAASRPIWRRFWRREKTGGRLPGGLRVVPTGRPEEDQEAQLNKVRRMRRTLEEHRVAVPDDAAPEDLLLLVWEHRPSWLLQWNRDWMRKNWGIALPDDATLEEYRKALDLLHQRGVRPRIPKLLFWRRFWPRIRTDLLDEVRSR